MPEEFDPDNMLKHIQKLQPDAFAFILFRKDEVGHIASSGNTGGQTFLEMIGLLEMAKNDILTVKFPITQPPQPPKPYKLGTP
jgi:hypothetical protein